MKGQQFRNRARTGKREKKVFGVKPNINPRPRHMWHQGIDRPFNAIIRECIDISGGDLCQCFLINFGDCFGQNDDLLEPQFDVVVQCCFNFDTVLNKQKRDRPFGQAAAFAFDKRC